MNSSRNDRDADKGLIWKLPLVKTTNFGKLGPTFCFGCWLWSRLWPRPSWRFWLRRPASFVRSRTPHQSSLRSFGVMATREIVASGDPWNRLVSVIKGGLAFSQSAGSLHISNGISEARSEDSTAPSDNKETGL